MAQYAILIYAHDSAHAPDATSADLETCDDHLDELAAGGSMLAAYALTPRDMATSVRADAITDGPFLESKEVVAGFYVIKAPDLDAALAIARLNPVVRDGGGVEVRARAYRQALALTTNDAERAFLSSQGAEGAADDACLGWKLLRRNLSDGHRGVLFGMAKVLFVVTGATYLVLKDGTRYATGYWAEEFANPYKELTDAGHEVVVATPGGVTPNVDMMSLRPSMAGGEQGALDLEAIIRSAEVLRRPLKVSDVRPEDYDAIYFPGGHGPMQDLAFDADVGRLLTAQLASGRPLAIVCHAPAAILSTRIGGVSPFKGYRVTCFTNDEEEAVGLASKTQWLLETELKEKVGVQFSRGALWEPFMVEDRNLITGQNPHSAAVLGERLLKVLG
jgi:putative intracellular protease/amidase